MAQIDNIINVNSVWNNTTILPVLESVTLKMWIYSGIQGNSAADNVVLLADNARPIDPTYTLKGTAISNGTDKVVSFDLAPLIKDYVESELNQTHNSDNAVWVDVQSTATISGTELVYASEHFLGLDGYEYTQNIVGSQLDEEIRISNRHILNSENKRVSVPLLRQSVASFTYTKGSVQILNATVAQSELSSEQILYAESPIAQEVDKLTVTYTDTTSEAITIEDICQDRYQHNKLTFVNRLGAFQDLWFFANSKKTLATKSSKWNRRNKLVGGGAYRATAVRNIDSVNETHTLNSGFYPESNNVVFEELIQAQNVWITQDGETFPIIIKNSSFNFKDSNTQKAINYTVMFEYAFNKMRSL